MSIHNPLFANASYINGQWLGHENTFAVHNPANGEIIANIADADVKQAERAITAAKTALPHWRAKSAAERSNLLRCWFDLMIAHKTELGELMTLEQGKPLAEAQGEITYGAGYVEWFAEEGKRLYGETIPAPSSDKRIIVVKQPVGVVAAVTPWNFPNSMITRKAAPALAAGCTFIIRPSNETPLSALALAKLAEKAGIPPGVFNVVASTDSHGIGRVLTESPDVDKFSFTGSTKVGRQLMVQSTSTIKRVSMELGGNAPFIVFEDADIEAAVQGLMVSKFRNAGQTCVCANRVFVQESVHDQFVKKLVQAVAKLKVGNGLEEGVTIGPLIHQHALQSIHQRVTNAFEQGARVQIGGEPHPLGGAFYSPTVLTEVTHDMDIATLEIFGPVAPIIKFSTEEDVIQQANDTPYGLAAYFYSQDVSRVWRVSNALDYGMIGANEGMISNPAAPFGGMKASGIGREGSKYGIDEYVEIKYICMGNLT